MAGTNKATATVSTTGSTSECVALRNTPLERLKLAAAGKADLSHGDLQRVLLDLLVDEHAQLKLLDDHSSALLEMLISPPQKKGKQQLDPLATLTIIEKLEANRERRSRGLVRLADLIHRVSAGPRPRLQVVANAAQFNVGTE